MTFDSRLSDMISALKCGDLSVITFDNSCMMNTLVQEFLSETNHTEEQLNLMDKIIWISNVLYNNTDMQTLPLSDGVYDMLIVVYNKYRPSKIGAEPIYFEPTTPNGVNLIEKVMLKPMVKIDQDDSKLFVESLVGDYVPRREDVLLSPMVKSFEMKKGLNTAHNYPELVGTLDKAKFVLNSQAKIAGAFDSPNVQIFERDFIQKHIESGILDPNEKFYMIGELKYDGVSVEAEVSNRILAARSRGDTEQDLASDITPVLHGYKFSRAKDISDVFGLKMEAIITYPDLQRLNQDTGKSYVNPRTAVVGIFGSNDGFKYRDYLTMIPLATSLGIDRMTEITFMNEFYTKGEPLRYSVFYGNYMEILFQVKCFVDEANFMRQFFPFMYDGVVISYLDEKMINALGRKKSINRYSIAIKFSPLSVQTTFMGYTFTVGQNGVITPMAHYLPVEFYGTIHDKSSIHSYNRFTELGLKVGDIIGVEYNHDVMPYVFRLDIEANTKNPANIAEFISNCPSCGSDVIISKSGKTAMCPNLECPERNIARMTNLLDKLNLKDFSDSTVRQIDKFFLHELLSLTLDDVAFLGPTNSVKFINRLNEIKISPIHDYRIIGALGFTSIALEKWKLILNNITIETIVTLPDDALRETLIAIKGVGPSTVDTIVSERQLFGADLCMIANMPNVIRTFGVKNIKTVRFTGVRDKDLVQRILEMGHNAGEGSVTKSTDILIVPSEGYTSDKTSKVGPNTIIVTIKDFVANIERYLS